MQVSVFSIRIDPAFLELDQQKLNFTRHKTSVFPKLKLNETRNK